MYSGSKRPCVVCTLQYSRSCSHNSCSDIDLPSSFFISSRSSSLPLQKSLYTSVWVPIHVSSRQNVLIPLFRAISYTTLLYMLWGTLPFTMQSGLYRSKTYFQYESIVKYACLRSSTGALLYLLFIMVRICPSHVLIESMSCVLAGAIGSLASAL